MEENVFNAGTMDQILREQTLSSSVFTDWLHPARKEGRQMLEQYEMDKVEPFMKMQGLKNAGINPLTAAAGIAGASTSSVPQPAASNNPIGDVAGAVGSVAGAAQNVVGAVSQAVKLSSELENIDADTLNKLAGAGLTNAQTQGVLTDNTYKDEDWKTRLNVQRQQFDNMKQELNNMQAIHREIMTHCDEMISQIELNGSLKDYNEALMTKVQEESRWMHELNDWRISHNLHIVDSGIDGYIFDLALNGADISQFDNFIDIYSEWRGRTQRAVSDAQNTSDINAAFEKAFNDALGKSDIQARFAPYLSSIDVMKSAMIEFYKAVIENPKNPIQAAIKAANLLSQLGTAMRLDDNVISKSDNPDVSPQRRR